MTELKFLDLLHIVVARRRSILVIMATAAIASVVLSKVFPPVYQVELRCLMPQKALTVGLSAPPSAEILRPILPSSGENELQSLTNILNLKVVEDMANEIAGVQLDTKTTDVDVDDSGIIAITTYSRDREKGQQTCLRMYDAMNALFRRVSLESNRRVREFIESELESIRRRRDASEGQLLEFQRDQEIVNLDQELQLLVAKRGSFANRVDQLVVGLRESNGRLASLQAELRKAEIEITTEQIADSPVITTLRNQLAQKEVQLATLLRDMTSNHPTVISATAARGELRRLLREEISRTLKVETQGLNPIQQKLQSDYIEARIDNEARQGELAAVQEVYTTVNEQALLAPEIRTRMSRLQSEVARDRKIEESLTAQLEEAKVQGVRELVSFEIIEGPTYPRKPKYPNAAANVLVSLALALIVSLVYCIVVERNDIERERAVRQVVFLDREMIETLSGDDA